MDATLPEADAVFLALPHGTAATLVPEIVAAGTAVIDLGPDFRLRDAADYPRWYGFEHPHPDLLDVAVYGLPEFHRAELEALVDCAGRHRRVARLLSDGDAARPRPPRARRPDRGPRGRCQERRLGRRPRVEARPDVRRGQREREGVRPGRPPPRRRDRAGARAGRRRCRPRAGRQPGHDRHRLPPPPHPDDPRHPLDQPRPADPGGRPRPSSTSCTQRPTPTSRS